MYVQESLHRVADKHVNFADCDTRWEKTAPGQTVHIFWQQQIC